MANSSRFDRIEAVAKAHIDAGFFSGIEWLVLRGGKTWAKGKLGMGDAPNGIPMPDSPIYRIYSMTKPMISALALMLVEQGKLRLFDPIAAYLPEFSEMSVLGENGKTGPTKGPIIVEHLLTHRAGFSYGFLSDCPVGNLYRKNHIIDAEPSLAEMVKNIAELPLAYEPGTEWRYSVATDVLARLVEVVAGKPLPEVLSEFLFDPIGMGDTGFMVEESQRHRIMAMFGNGDLDYIMDFDDKPQSLIPTDVSVQYPAGDPKFYRGGHGLFSTLDDYARLVPFLATGLAPNGERLLSRKMVELMLTNRIPPEQLPLRIGPINVAGYGFGLAGRVLIEPGAALGLTSIGESGWAGAASTYFWIDKSEDLTGIVMSQYLGSKLPLGDDIRSAVYQALDD
jgi:CubicO group peptidase (beta-lactamase class C family)